MFYNFQRKHDFLQKYPLDRANRVFDMIAPMEEELDTDVADANYRDLKLIMSQIVFATTSTYYTYINILDQYVNYSIQSGNSKQNENSVRRASKEIDLSITNIKTFYPKDDLDLASYLNQMLGKPQVNGTYVKIYALIALYYCGFSKEQILKLKYEDLNFQLSVTDDYYIYPSLLPAIQCAYKSTTYVSRGGGVRYYPKNIDHHIIQGGDMKVFKLSATTLNKLKGNSDRFFTLEHIRVAGEWYKRFLREQYITDTMQNNKYGQEHDYQKYKETYY